MRELEGETKHGINIDGQRLTHLRFADDIIQMSSSAKDLETMLRDLDTVSREIGLTMNTSKTKNHDKRQRNTHPYERRTGRVRDGLHLPRSDPVLSKLSQKINEKMHCTSLEEILEPETHLDGETSENELEGGNTRNMHHTSTNIWLSNLVTIKQTKTNDPSMSTENGTQNHPCHTTRLSTMQRFKKKHRHERRCQPSRET